MSEIASGVIERQVGPCRLLVLPTDIRDVVTIRGSFFSWPDFGSGQELLQTLAVDLLDKGSETRDKMQIARVLEDLGAGLNFSSHGTRVQFSGRFLSAHAEKVVPLLGEQLQSPGLGAAEFDKSVKQIDASLLRAGSNTGYRADVALYGSLLSKDHPGFTLEPEAEREDLSSAQLSEVAQYYATHMQRGPLTIVAVGDVHIETLAAAFERAFSARGRDEQAIHTWAPTEVGNASRTHVPVEDRANLDVRLGHGLPVRRTDQDYLPLFVGNFILGGNFSGRLMSHVRDEKGLTYGIGSALSGITAQHDGVWRIAVTLSADKLEAGIQATRETLERFLQEGPSAKEVSRAIATLSGQYVVGLATTSGLASTLRAHADNGFPVAYIDQYPEELAALTPTSVCEAVRKHLRPESLRVVSAGSAL